MKRKLLKILYLLLFYTGIVKLCYLVDKRQRVLVYHNVIPDDMWDDSVYACTSIKESTFRKHIEIVSSRMKSSKNIGELNSVIISFDDGYRSALIASNILEEYGLRGVFFMPNSNIGANNPLWIDVVMVWFSKVPNGEYIINGDTYVFDDNKRHRGLLYNRFYDSIYNKKIYDIKKLLKSLDEIYPLEQALSLVNKSYFELRFCGLTKSEIISMKQKGHIFGGHSCHHDILTLLSDEDLYNDFKSSHCLLNDGVLNVNWYAYPYGHFRDVDKREIEYCKHAGFEYAFMNEVIPHAAQYQLSRLNLGVSENRYEIEAKLSGITTFIKRCVKWIS